MTGLSAGWYVHRHRGWDFRVESVFLRRPIPPPSITCFGKLNYPVTLNEVDFPRNVLLFSFIFLGKRNGKHNVILRRVRGLGTCRVQRSLHQHPRSTREPQASARPGPSLPAHRKAGSSVCRGALPLWLPLPKGSCCGDQAARTASSEGAPFSTFSGPWCHLPA